MKKYEYIRGESASFTVTIGDRNRTIIFAGGQIRPFRVNPFYKTADPEVQEAIEAISVFGTEIKEIKVPVVVGETETAGPVLPVIPVIPGGTAQEDITPPVGEGAPEGEGASFPEVTKVQDAREVLIANFAQKASELPNKDAILARASELKVVFPNLK